MAVTKRWCGQNNHSSQPGCQSGNEAIIQKAISALTAGKTLIVIAHRLSTITGADNIVVVNAGNIEAQGTHEQLLIRCPLYKDMWQAHIGARDEA